MGTADAELLATAAAAVRRRAEMQRAWPKALHEELPRACDALAGEPALLAELTAELSEVHVPQLLAHDDNVARVTAMLTRADSAKELLGNLVELRQNQTLSAGAPSEPTAAGASSSSGGAGMHRVRHVRSAEEWYDVLRDVGDGLVVADFGASWCEPCQQVKPLFERLSSLPGFESVTFVSIDAEDTPALIGDNRVNSFPTFKCVWLACLPACLPAFAATAVQPLETFNSAARTTLSPAPLLDLRCPPLPLCPACSLSELGRGGLARRGRRYRRAAEPH